MSFFFLRYDITQISKFLRYKYSKKVKETVENTIDLVFFIWYNYIVYLYDIIKIGGVYEKI